MSLTNTAIPSPSLLWSFESSNVDTITSLAPSYSTVTTASQYIPSYVSGKVGQAVYFNNQVNYNYTSANSFMVYTISSGLGITSNNSTYSFWINPQYANLPTLNALKAGVNNILQIIDGATNYKFITNGFSNPGGSNGIFFTGGQNLAISFSPSLQAYNTGSWCHAAVALSNVGARTGTTISYFYFNGVLQGSNTHTIGTTAGTVGTLYLGAQLNGVPANAVMGGLFYMDDLRVYNQVLYPHQILAIYNLGAAPTLIPPSAPNMTVYKSPGYTTPTILSGTPVFSQLSPGATASAVGAFSLRALNGVTAKTIKVRPNIIINPPTSMSGAIAGGTPTITGPGPFTQTLYGYGFASGVYTANCSSYSATNTGPDKMFDFDSTTYWESGFSGVLYNGYGGIVPGFPSANSYTQGTFSTTISGTAYGGQWCQMKMPSAINIKTYSFIGRYGGSLRLPYWWIIGGSNDGITWTTVDSTYATSGFSSHPSTFTPNTAYAEWTYFRVVTMAVNGNGVNGVPVNIASWTINGSSLNWNIDFYADRLGNLLTTPVTGQSISTWLGGVTGYVTTLYDQTGSNNLVQTNTSYQPTINLSTTPASINFAPSSNLALTGYTFTASPYTLVTSLSAVSAGSNALTIGTRNWGLYNSTGTTGGLYPGVFSAAEGRATSATALTASTKTTVAFVSPTPTVYVGGSTVSTTGTFTYSSGQDVAPGTIQVGGTFTGQVYECSLFHSSLTASDILKF